MLHLSVGKRACGVNESRVATWLWCSYSSEKSDTLHDGEDEAALHELLSCASKGVSLCVKDIRSCTV